MEMKLLLLLWILKSISCNPVLEEDAARIVGGTPAGLVPYQCSIRKDGSHYCGCAIISDKWILTAAHCLGSFANKFKIKVGTNNLKSGGQELVTEKVIRHPKYKEIANEEYTYDIGLIRVKGNIKFNKNVQAIKYGTSKVPAGSSLLTTGWGFLSASKTGPMDLQQLKVKATSDQDCKKAWPKIDNSLMCTTAPKGKGLCYADSGGPLVMGSTLVGLVSFGIPCATGVPDVFTRVSHFASWIKQNAK